MNMDLLLKVVIVVVISYLCGSFPTGYLIARLRGVNIFEIGSGNMGATNVIRIMGLAWGLCVWFLDSAKAIIAVLIALRIMPEAPAQATVLAAIFAIIGHNWSAWIALLTGRIRGGKGAATAFGALLMIVPLQVIAVMLVIGGLIIAVTRYVSLAVLLMFGLATAWMILLFVNGAVPVEYLIFSLVLAALLVFRFRENIKRLMAGTERRLGETT